MHHQLEWRVQDTQEDVVSEPNDKKPARPVAATEHEYSAKNREQPDETNPDKLPFKRTLCLELRGMVGQSDDSGCQEYPTDDRNGAWTFGHGALPR